MNELAESRLKTIAVASRLLKGTARTVALNLQRHPQRSICERGHEQPKKRSRCGLTQCDAKVLTVSGRCRLCEEPLPQGRISWCSEECRESFYLVASSSVLRYHVYQRDRGVCATCNTDCSELEKRVYGYDTMQKLPNPSSAVKHSYHQVMAMRREMHSLGFTVGSKNRSFWDADHVVALEEGGDWRLENVQTLCQPCHREKTSEHTGRRARIKRIVGKKHAATKRARLLAGVSK